MLKATIPESKDKIKKQIEALKHLLREDTNEKDKKIHEEALNALQEALEALETVENTPSKAGRPRTIKKEIIQELKNKGYTQEKAARELNVSISTVTRNWK